MRRNWIGGCLAAVAALTAPALVRAADTPPAAATQPPAIVKIGAAYVAKQYCSCLFVAGRPESSCKPEFKPQIDMAKVDVDRTKLPARAKVSVALGPVVAEATYSRRYGCVLSK